MGGDGCCAQWPSWYGTGGKLLFRQQSLVHARCSRASVPAPLPMPCSSWSPSRTLPRTRATPSAHLGSWARGRAAVAMTHRGKGSRGPQPGGWPSSRQGLAVGRAEAHQRDRLGVKVHERLGVHGGGGASWIGCANTCTRGSRTSAQCPYSPRALQPDTHQVLLAARTRYAQGVLQYKHSPTPQAPHAQLQRCRMPRRHATPRAQPRQGPNTPYLVIVARATAAGRRRPSQGSARGTW